MSYTLLLRSDEALNVEVTLPAEGGGVLAPVYVYVCLCA